MSDLIVTPVFRLAFPELFTAASFQGGKEKYSLKMLFPKKEYPQKDRIDPLWGACVATAKAEWPTAFPPGMKPTFRDGDEVPNWDGFPGNWFVGAWSYQQPTVVDAGCKLVADPRKVYGGMYARAQVQPFAYDTMGNRGVGFMLYMVQIVREGTPFAGGPGDAGDVFGKVDGGWSAQDARTPAGWTDGGDGSPPADDADVSEFIGAGPDVGDASDVVPF